MPWLSLLLPLSFAAPPDRQEDLNDWWAAAGDIWLGDTAYVIGSQPLGFSDGMCDFTLNEGALIPVYSGKAPVSERMIGLVWMGDGELSMRFESRGDVWRFANHLAATGAADEATLRPLLSGAPHQSNIDRGVILSADPSVLSLLKGLQPMGAGAVYDGDGESDETYVVTETRGGWRARAVGTNLLEDRLRALQRSGLDPQVMLRQDRLLNEELGVQGDQLRALADFRTDTPLRVASAEGDLVGPGHFDRWVSCYRDGQDPLDLGYASMAFTHGVDQDQRRHFMRLTGQAAAEPGSPERPAFAPMRADSTVEVTPNRRGLERTLSVTSNLTIRAEGGDLQHLTLQMPTGDALLGSWTLEAITLEDGTPLRWVGLSADLEGRNDNSADPQAPASENSIDRSTSATLSSGGAQVGRASSGVGVGSGGATSLGSSDGTTNAENIALSEQLAFAQTPYRYEVMALLPEAVPDGDERTVQVRWTADYRFARFSTAQLSQPDGADMNATPRSMYRPLGSTIGAQPLLPVMMPTTDDPWAYSISARAPQPPMALLELVASGDTVESSVDEGTGDLLVRTEGIADDPVITVGRWAGSSEPAADNLPEVQLNLFPRTVRDAKGQLGPELRRITVFLHKHLPDFPDQELEVYQQMRAMPLETLQANRPPTMPGVIELQTVVSPTITSSGLIRTEYPEFTRVQLAEQVAGQYWGATVRPASARDAWIMDGLAGTYAALYVRAAVGVDAYTEHMDALQRRLERPREYTVGRGGTTPWKKAGAQRPLSLTDPVLSDVPAPIRADYATYVLAEQLRPRIGDDAFFGALHQLAASRQAKTITTEELQAAFETESNQDLSDFFDFWIHAGRIPSLTLTWTEAGGRVTGCLEADVPFGQLDVPVYITDDNGTVSAPLRVVDGVALFESEDRAGRVDVELDPHSHILARTRDVQRSRSQSCLDGYSSAD